jgi:hypothetical protein
VDATPEPSSATGAQGRRSLVGTWTEVLADTGGLLRAEARMARIETSDNLRSLGHSGAAIGAGLVLLTLALVFATVAGVVALAAVIGLVWALVGVAVLCLGGGLALVSGGLGRLSRQALLPERTLQRVSDDLDRLAARAEPAPSADASEPLAPGSQAA